MKFLFLSAMFLFAGNVFAQTGAAENGNLVTEGIPAIPDSITERSNQYQQVRSASISDWSADGKSMLMSTRFGDSYQIHKIDNPGGDRRQLTFFKEPVSSATYCPLAAFNGFMFTKDVGGNEFTQLYWFDMATGKYDVISGGSRVQTSLPAWSNSGKQFVIVSTKRNGKDYDFYLGETDHPKDLKMILQEGGSWSVKDWSPDDHYLLAGKYISANRSQLYILETATGKLEEINPSKEDIAYGDAVWSADGKGIYIINDEGSEFMTLKYYDMASKKFTALTSSIPWNLTVFAKSRDRKKNIFSVNENGISKLYLFDPSANKYSAIPGLPSGIISGIRFNPMKNEIGMTINTAQSPGDIYTCDLSSFKLTRWTYSETGGLTAGAFTVPSLISYNTFDKVNGDLRKIPAFYYRPQIPAGKKMPVVIMIHGGPESQSVPSFNSFASYLNHELGIAVIAPNVRGSSGYGKTYLKLDNGFSRIESVKDIGALLDWIEKQPELDASRVAVYGGSYGGYMVLASMVMYNDRLKCGIDVVGISNFNTFLAHTEEYRRDLRRVEYGDERDPQMKAFLEEISPANNVKKITKPLFIVQGLNDPRVPVTEAEQMKQKMKEEGGDVWYLLAKDEGHGFKKKTNIDYLQWSMILFLQEKLIGRPAGE
jgi:dipeptidyl aminopeptidase/acylaminoacyl peptidase